MSNLRWDGSEKKLDIDAAQSDLHALLNEHWFRDGVLSHPVHQQIKRVAAHLENAIEELRPTRGRKPREQVLSATKIADPNKWAAIVANAFIANDTIEEAAKALDVGLRTAKRWKRHPMVALILIQQEESKEAG